MARILNKESQIAKEKFENIIKKLQKEGKIEEFKDVKGYEGKYQVSNFGRIWSVKYKKFLSSSFIKACGYFFNGQIKRYVHHLVAEAFIENSSNEEIVDHIDQEKLNNSVWNLRYVSRKENAQNIDRSKFQSSKENLEKFYQNLEELDKSSKCEIWKDIPGCDGNYQISSFGRLKSVRYDRCLAPSAHKSGYYKYNSLKINGQKKSEFVHRLVAKVFIYNHEGKKQVDHINGNKADNSIWNLQWLNASENCKKIVRSK